MTNHPNKNCPVCDSPVPEDAPAGLCPKCVLGGAEGVTKSSIFGGKHSAPASIEEIAPHFPELELIELLGAGGMGAVYKARQPQLDRTVALKILSAELATDPTFVERFNREAKVLAILNHPNIVSVHDFGVAGPHCYLLMEYVDGVNLRQTMQTGGVSPSEALSLVQEICTALKFAHDEGILHRDIKPENVLIDSKGSIKIADFGIAKLVGEEMQPDITLTMQGSVLGSPHYMAPEQIEKPDEVDQRADIYSLGVVLYEMLTGELPIGRFALPSQKASMDARIDEIVLRTLEKERDARFQSAEEVRTSVDALASSPPPITPGTSALGSDGQRPAAKFSFSAAILTGISLILAPLFFFVFIMNMKPVAVSSGAAEVSESISSGLPAMILAAAMILLGAGSALFGFIFGAVALGQIRRSRGVMTGLGQSIFAIVPWPIILLFSLSVFFLTVPIPLIYTIPVMLLTFLGACILLIRGLIRCGGGISMDNGDRNFPSLMKSLLPAVIVYLVGPVLLLIPMLIRFIVYP